MTKRIPLFEIPWDETDISNAVESLSRGSYWAKGPFVDEFEHGLESYFGLDHAVSTNSGTTALVAALEACGIGPGDEVIVPSFTFIATANVAKIVGADPVFADIESDTFGLDPDSVKSKITEETAAIIPVHIYGAPCRIHELRKIATENDLWLIEDAAEAFGATASGELVGTIGDIAALSFCQNKILPTGEGGAVITNNTELAREASQFCNHGRVNDDYFGSVGSGKYETVGSNYRMPDIVAAIGCAQLSKIDDLIESRRAVAAHYRDGIADISGVEPHTSLENDSHVFQLFTIVLKDQKNRQQIIEKLTNEKISCKIYWDPPLHRGNVFTADAHLSLPITESVSNRVLSLPMYPTLSFESVDRVVDLLRDAAEGFHNEAASNDTKNEHIE